MSPRAWSVRRHRRAFLRDGMLVLAASSASVRGAAAPSSASQLRFGLVTDLHYADKPAAGTRCYRETLDKLAEAKDRFQDASLEFLVELGDLIDAADAVDTELAYLRRVNREFASVCEDRHYVLGNHCVDTLRKAEFLQEVGQERSYYSFRRSGIHLIVLDACFRHDGAPYGRGNFQWTDTNVPPEELEWLAAELADGDDPVIVFVHQRLDVSDKHGVRNNAAIRERLERSGRVLGVFQGHSHRNDYREIAGIHYCTHVAMVEGSGAKENAYSIVDVRGDGSIHLHGFRRQRSYEWQEC
jgi:hypothetical protein